MTQTMQSFTVDLTDQEKALLNELRFDTSGMAASDVRRNGEIAAKLTHSVMERRAVPEHRERYFTDPGYNIGGRGRSRREGFERNDCRGGAILRHPRFLPHLRYFLFGAHLPSDVIVEFCSAVRDCSMVTSSDVAPLGLLARRLARQHGLSPDISREEFFKLALDCDIDLGAASSIRQSAGQR